MKWRIAPGQSLRRRVWQEEGVIYNDLSGDTHLLGAGALSLLALLEQAGRDSAALAAELDPEGGPALAAEVDSVLLDLQQLSLVESI